MHEQGFFNNIHSKQPEEELIPSRATPLQEAGSQGGHKHHHLLCWSNPALTMADITYQVVREQKPLRMFYQVCCIATVMLNGPPTVWLNDLFGNFQGLDNEEDGSVIMSLSKPTK